MGQRPLNNAGGGGTERDGGGMVKNAWGERRRMMRVDARGRNEGA